MTTEADEPAVTAVPAPSPQQMPPLMMPPELQQQLSQDILNGFGAEIGRLSGQLIVNSKTHEMEKLLLQAQVSQLQQQLVEAGVAPKSEGSEPPAAPPVGAPVTPIRKEAPPRPPKKSTSGKNKRH